MDLKIFNGEEFLGSIKLETNIKEGAIMEIIQAHPIGGEQLDVLRVKDMDYGIVIPTHIASIMNTVVDKAAKDEKNTVAFCMRCFTNSVVPVSEKTNFCRNCGSEGTCIEMKDADAKYLRENIEYLLERSNFRAFYESLGIKGGLI
jgi:hypothetical protein